jgi:hypothetical protein
MLATIRRIAAVTGFLGLLCPLYVNAQSSGQTKAQQQTSSSAQSSGQTKAQQQTSSHFTQLMPGKHLRVRHTLRFSKTDYMIRTISWDGRRTSDSEMLLIFGNHVLHWKVDARHGSFQADLDNDSVLFDGSFGGKATDRIAFLKISRKLKRDGVEAYLAELVAKFPHPLVVTPLAQFSAYFSPSLNKQIHSSIASTPTERVAALQLTDPHEGCLQDGLLTEGDPDTGGQQESAPFCGAEYDHCVDCGGISDWTGGPQGGGGDGGSNPCLIQWIADQRACVDKRNKDCSRVCPPGPGPRVPCPPPPSGGGDVPPDVDFGEGCEEGSGLGNAIVCDSCTHAYDSCMSTAESSFNSCSFRRP